MQYSVENIDLDVSCHKIDLVITILHSRGPIRVLMSRRKTNRVVTICILNFQISYLKKTHRNCKRYDRTNLSIVSPIMKYSSRERECFNETVRK